MSKTRTSPTFLALVFASCALFAAQPVAVAQEGSPEPEVKVGLVDLKRIFSEYYRTKIIAGEVEKADEITKKEVEEKRQAGQGLIAEFRALEKKLNDPTLGDSARAGHKKAAESKAAELRTLDADIKEYVERKRRQTVKEAGASKAEILNEINTKISAIAMEDGLDAVFDKSSRSSRGFPFVVYVDKPNDISDKVIASLNANAPKTASPAAPTTE